MKRTPLFQSHVELGGRLIEFGGWEMPVQYSGIVDEHLTVRNHAGLFDISHMGEVLVEGVGAAGFLNHILTNDVNRLIPGVGQYSLMCLESGGVIDDLYVFRIGQFQYLLIINASRIEADLAWLNTRKNTYPQADEFILTNLSDLLSGVAIQGPNVADWIDACLDGVSGSNLKKNGITRFKYRGAEAFVSRTGYTGEDGFEVILPNEVVVNFWASVLKAGSSYGLKPAGLGARDTLRAEACYPLYGHELSETISPIEAGLGSFVKLDKGEFVGRSALLLQKNAGVIRKSVAFVMTDKSPPPRQGYLILDQQGTRMGEVTTGTQSPSLQIGIGMGLLDAKNAICDTNFKVEIRGRQYGAKIQSKPLVKKKVS